MMEVREVTISFKDSPELCSDFIQIKRSFEESQEMDVIFNLQMLNDKELIIRTDNKIGIGVLYPVSGDPIISNVKLRITAAGMEYLEAIEKKSIWDIIRTEYPNAGLSTTILVAKTVLTKFIENQIKQLT